MEDAQIEDNLLLNDIQDIPEPQEEKKLDPTNIQTTILAQEFLDYEEKMQLKSKLIENEFLSKILHYVDRGHPLRIICFFIIWVSFFCLEPSWCRNRIEKGDFHTEDVYCSQDLSGNKYYTNEFYHVDLMTAMTLTWICVFFVTVEESLGLFVQSNWRTKIRCGSILLFGILDVVFGLIYLAGYTEWNWNNYFRIGFLIATSRVLRNAFERLIFTMLKCWEAVILYLILMYLGTCFVYV